MINSLSIGTVATYDVNPQVLDNLGKINFLFGANGSGKTTIGRVIASEDDHATCQVRWRSDNKLETLVYNRDFVDKNFDPSIELKGVFTLGEKNVDTLEKITTAKQALQKDQDSIATYRRTLDGEDGHGGKRGELRVLEEGIKAKCWKQKVKHDAALQGAFEGYRGNQDKFKTKVLDEWEKNIAPLLDLPALQKKAETVFGPAPTVVPLLPMVDVDSLAIHEANPILKTRVVGKTDVNIAAMIEKLKNSDWVRQGISFYNANESICPFCQQATHEKFSKDLGDYFDETFEASNTAIRSLNDNYTTESQRLLLQLDGIIAAPSKFLEVDKLKTERDLLAAKTTVNIQRLALKGKETSQVVELDVIGNVAAAIKALLDTANASAVEHNRTVANLAQERRDLTDEVWRYLAEIELKADLEAYDTSRKNLNSGIQALEAQIVSANTERTKILEEIRALEKTTTSIQPTIDGINRLLKSFGFQSFLLAKADSGNCYRLLRPDGKDARHTLSEGEKTFVTFLYFYHLLKGSASEAGTATDRVVVFDDPVSSLDSDILFIVSSLIRGLFEEARAKDGRIQQIFVFTHNVYFHKQVSFVRARKGEGKNMTFWVVRKSGAFSKVERHESNPIKTSYELLWAEIRNPDRSGLTIQNTMRRILENYFKILGNVPFDEICDRFDGKEKLICNALFSWVNDGSHNAHDDLSMSVEDTAVESYLSVFRAIFEKMDHAGHYEMMMGPSYIEEAETVDSETAVAG